eukprot:6199433-Pleurochrysis_carterae.AAC.2
MSACASCQHSTPTPLAPSRRLLRRISSCVAAPHASAPVDALSCTWQSSHSSRPPSRTTSAEPELVCSTLLALRVTVPPIHSMDDQPHLSRLVPTISTHARRRTSTAAPG